MKAIANKTCKETLLSDMFLFQLRTSIFLRSVFISESKYIHLAFASGGGDKVTAEGDGDDGLRASDHSCSLM